MTETQVWSGRYELIRRIARGGMAEVHWARDLLLDRPVALKVLYPELSRDQTFVERFRREAQAAANLSHPNIVSVYDWGEETGTYFIVMEFVDGESLASLLHRGGALQPDEAAEIGAEIAAALSVAHRNEMVHRDVKPGNVLIDRNGQVKVTDFGIARAVNTTENLTQPGSVMGTATYFSPEQAQGQRIDPRSDVYSLGVVLYELVTGAPPFSADSPVAVAYKHVREEPVPPSRHADVPEGFERIVLRAMAKDPDDRYSSALEMRDDLVRFRQGQEVSAPVYAAPPPRDRTQAVPATAAAPVPAGPPAAAYGGEVADRRTGAYIALLVGLLALLGVLLFLLGRTLGVFGGGSGELVTVPLVTTLPRAEAEAKIREAGLEPIVTEEASERAPDTVFNQDPAANQRVEEGSTVRLFVSRGTPGVEVPDVVGESEDTARQILDQAGFQVTVTEESNRDKPDGTVLTQSPNGGAEAPQGSTVALVISSGTPQGQVPDVTNLPEADARSRLIDEGFEVKVAREESAEVQKGRVIRTEPEAGTEADLGTTVTMVVSSGPPEPEESTVPDVRGRTEAEATRILNEAGFRVAKRSETVVRQDEDGVVIEQQPGAGQEAEKGSIVTITIGRLAGGGGGGGGGGGSSSTTTTTTA
jgi:eukaryotic-like serine/threonine-protein kinase